MHRTKRLLLRILFLSCCTLWSLEILAQVNLVQCTPEKRQELRLQGLLDDVISWRCGDFPKARILARLSDSAVREGSEGSELVVQLNRQPASPVRISLRSTLPEEVLFSVDDLIFTPANWNQPQTIQLQSVDDDTADGDQLLTVQLAVAATADFRFRQASPVGLTVESLDNDAIDWNVTRQPGRLQEGSSPVIYELSLRSRPLAPLMLRIENRHPEHIRVAPEEIEITPERWPQPELLRIQALDDPFDNPDRPVEVLVSVKSTADPGYAQLTPLRLQLLVEDDENPGLVVTPERGTTAEYGTRATFQVRLRSQPRNPVLLDVNSSDDTEGRVDVQQLRFTAADWDQPQSIVVQGLDDLQRDGDQPFQLRLQVGSEDAAYQKLPIFEVPLTNTDDDNAALQLETTSDQISEDGDSVEVSLRLRSEPKGRVLVTLSVDPPNEATVFPESLAFDKNDWNLRKRLLVVGKDDNAADGDQTVTISLRLLGDSPEYISLPSQQLTLTNRDNDIASILIRSPERLVTSEAGISDHFEVLLQSRPEAAVRIPLRTSQPEEVQLSPESLIFQPDEWDQPQRVAVSGLDDEKLDGPQSFLINVLPAESTDQLYHGLDATDLVGSNEDNDRPGVLTTKGNLRVEESFGEDQMQVQLASRPNLPVRIRLTSSAPNEFSVLPEQLVFSPENWNQAQTVTVRGLPDEVPEKSSTYQLSLSIESGEEDYQALEVTEVVVAVEDQTPELPPTMVRAMRGLQYVAGVGRLQRGKYEENGTELGLGGQSIGVRYNHHWPSHFTAGVSLERAELTGEKSSSSQKVAVELREYKLQATGGYAWYLSPAWRVQPELRLAYGFLSAKRREESSRINYSETIDGGVFTAQFGSGVHYLANETFFVGAGLFLDPNQTSLGFAQAEGKYQINWSSEFLIGLQF